MQFIKVILLLGILLSSLFAGGVGVYMLNVINEKTTDPKNGEYGYSPGIGISVDSNLGRDIPFNYRFNLDYYKASGTIPRSNGEYLNINKSALTISQVFGFSVYRSKRVRFWLGPMMGLSKINSRYHYGYNGFPDPLMGPAIGLNYQVNDSLSVALDTSVSILAGQSFGLMRLYVYWRFDETYQNLDVK